MMSAPTSTILLWLFILNLGVAFGAGLYEHRIAVPSWTSSDAFSYFIPTMVRLRAFSF